MMHDFAERYAPILSALITGSLLLYFKSEMLVLAAADSLDTANLYTAVFDWSAIQTGFLFGIYGFVAGKSSGFIYEIRNTSAMLIFIKYTKVSLFLGFLVTFVSIPLIVSKFNFVGSDTKYYIFLMWSSVSVWAFLSFARVAYLFGLLLKVKDVEKLPAG